MKMIISVLFLGMIYLYITYTSCRSSYNLDSKTIELYKQKVNNNSDCNVGIELAIYYAEIKKDEELAEIWMNKVSECGTSENPNP